MKKYLVIGNPIEHSLSPELHNYWLKINKIDAVYDKKKIHENEIKNLISDAESTQSVNTIFLENDKLIGHNTDIDGFKISIENLRHDIADKKVLILGGGGVVPSIIFALNKIKMSKIYLSNRTRNKAENLKTLFKDITLINWGEIPDFDIIINATSVGLNKNEEIGLNLSNVGTNKLFFDVI